MLSLGDGIATGSLFLALGATSIVYIRSYFSSGKRESEELKDGGQNGHIRRGEHDEGLDSLRKRIDEFQEQNKAWWKQLDRKIDTIGEDFKAFNERITKVETVQELCKTNVSSSPRE